VVATTPRARLHHYGSGNGPPLLIIYSLVNRAYILDINAKRSVIAKLVAAGFDVYLLDWMYPDSTWRFDTLDDYLAEDIADATDQLTRDGQPPHVLGVCQGGVLALCFAAAFPDAVRTVTTLVTPVDFHTPDDQLARLAYPMNLASLVAATGNVPATALNALFTSLKPFQLYGQRYLGLADIGANDEALTEFLKLERWMYDSPDQPGEAFLQFAREFYQRNRLLTGEIELANRVIDLGAIRAPVFNAYARDDHLVPPEAASALGPALSHNDYEAIELPGGHLGMFISSGAHREVYPALADWLQKR
jgi:polyhydroxyalkanoate synthase